MTDTCPMCGQAVRVVTSDEGTSYYEPVAGLVEEARARADALWAAYSEAAGDRRQTLHDDAKLLVLLAAALEASEAERVRLRGALRDLYEYVNEVEGRLAPWVITRPGIASYPEGAKALGERVRAALADEAGRD